MLRVVRGNRMLEIPNSQHMSLDPLWNSEDRARYATLLARASASAAAVASSAPVNPLLIQCAVWKHKVPGLTYDSNITAALAAALK